MVSLHSNITYVFPSLDKSIVGLRLVFSFHVKFSQWRIIALFLHFQCSWLVKQCVATLSQSNQNQSWLASRFIYLFRNLIGSFCCSRMLWLARVTDLFPVTGFLALDSGFMYFSRNLIGPFYCSRMLWLARVTDLPPVTAVALCIFLEIWLVHFSVCAYLDLPE